MAHLVGDVEADGRIVTQLRDPPGQRSIYIPPGNTEKETYRFSTFKDFPSNVPIDPRQFASNGFYYTGYKDRVKCFSCGQSCDNWMNGDDISLPGWHREDCQFINGTDTSNVAMDPFFQAHHQRNAPSNNLPPRQQQNENGSSSSMPPYSAKRENHAQLSENGSHPSSLFPCLHPVNPHMGSMEARLQTFRDNANIWPAHRIRATPQEIADAGLFYLGERDRTKCWYCNGGLQNWERDDNPWEEHAKWFPMCEFLLQKKGPEFVHEIVSKFPNLRRPTLFNPTTAVAANTLARAVQAGPTFGFSQRAPVVTDPQEARRERNMRIEEEMRSSELVAQARLMGFEDRLIREAFIRKYELDNQPFSSVESLIHVVVDIPQQENHAQELSSSQDQARGTASTTYAEQLALNQFPPVSDIMNWERERASTSSQHDTLPATNGSTIERIIMNPLPPESDFVDEETGSASLHPEIPAASSGLIIETFIMDPLPPESDILDEERDP